MNEKQKWSVSFVGWLASISASEWSMFIGMVGGMLVIFYTAMQMYVLWRDKIRRHDGRSGDEE